MTQWTGAQAPYGVWRWLALLAGLGLLASAWIVPPLWAGLAAGFLLLIGLSLRFPLVGIVLLTFSIPWGGGFPLPISGFPITTTEVLVAALTGAWLVSAVIERRNPFTTGMWLPYLAMFLGAILLSTVVALDRHASEREILKWLELGAVYCSAAWFLHGRRDIELVVGAIVAGGVSQAVLGYVQTLFSLGPAAFTHGLALRAYGTFDQPNPYAGYLNMTLPFALAMMLLAPSAVARRWYAVAVVLITGALLASESRGALLAGLLASAVVVASARRGWHTLVWSAILAGIGAAWLATFGLLPLGPFDKLLGAVGLGNVSFGYVTNANFSAVERAAHWLAGVRMFAAHPLLGVGIGNYATAYPAYHPRGWYDPLAHAHNYLINIAAEAGILGLATYALLAGSALWYSYAISQRETDPVLRAVGFGVLGALVATNFHNLFDALYVHGLAALLGLMVAFLPVIVRCASTPDPHSVSYAAR